MRTLSLARSRRPADFRPWTQFRIPEPGSLPPNEEAVRPADIDRAKIDSGVASTRLDGQPLGVVQELVDGEWLTLVKGLTRIDGRDVARGLPSMKGRGRS